jgi:hypothetical protein
MTIVELAKSIRSLLKNKGINTIVHTTSSTKRSVYVKFENNKIGSLRVSNHPSRSKYSYRWELRTDINEVNSERVKNHNTWKYPEKDINKLVNHIVNYNKTIVNNQKAIK